MGVFQRILKNLLSMFLSNIISIVTELVQPVVFLRSYGAGYADWLVLTAAVAYLGTLNFGLQTFVNQDLAMRFNRGERESYHVQQSTALRALLGIAAVAAVACLVIFVLPVERWLGLAIPHWTAVTALYFIALQVLLGALIFSYFAGTFMGVGMAHRGNNWNSAQRFGSAVLITALAWFHASFTVLAVAQFGWYVLILTAMLIDLRRVGPEIFPTLRHWDSAALRAMLRPSGYFGVLYWSTFLCYQLPVILLRKMTGPGAVVTLALGRKIFGLGRQVLNGITQSMGPEITLLYGRGDWTALAKLYQYSERMIFALIAMVSVPLFIFSPVLLHYWLIYTHRPDLIQFDLWAYLLMATINTALCVKEHKYQFQFSTNTHVGLAKLMAVSYLVMSAVAVATIHFYGLIGFLATWLAAELVQTMVIVRMNHRLFSGHTELEHGNAYRLAGLAALGLGGGALVIHATLGLGYPRQSVAELCVGLPVVAGSAYLFGVHALWMQLQQRLAGRVA